MLAAARHQEVDMSSGEYTVHYTGIRKAGESWQEGRLVRRAEIPVGRQEIPVGRQVIKADKRKADRRKEDSQQEDRCQEESKTLNRQAIHKANRDHKLKAGRQTDRRKSGNMQAAGSQN
jgi:hypothetical protein